MEYERKTVDFYKMDLFLKGKWITVLDTDDVYKYKELYNILIFSTIKHRGKKYRRIKER